MRLIDADELRTYIDGYIERRKLSEHDRIVFEGFKGIIDNAPTVNTDEIYKKGYHAGFFATHGEHERPQGEWIFTNDDYGFWHCNQCKAIGSPNNNFCPNCGTDMRGIKE